MRRSTINRNNALAMRVALAVSKQHTKTPNLHPQMFTGMVAMCVIDVLKEMNIYVYAKPKVRDKPKSSRKSQ